MHILRVVQLRTKMFRAYQLLFVFIEKCAGVRVLRLSVCCILGTRIITSITHCEPMRPAPIEFRT